MNPSPGTSARTCLRFLLKPPLPKGARGAYHLPHSATFSANPGAALKRYQSWTLPDVRHDVWLDRFDTDAAQFPLPGGTADWAIRKRALPGGLRDGIDLV